MDVDNFSIVWSNIFKYLPAKDLATCRLICPLWKDIISTFSTKTIFWKKHCRIDYPKIGDIALKKSGSDITGYQIYMSLSLWPILSQAEQIKQELFSRIDDFKVLDFQILRDGVLAILSSRMIIYYKVYDFNLLVVRGSIHTNFLKYKENNFLILGLDIRSKLTVIIKRRRNDNFGETHYLDEVKLFLPLEKNVYYVSIDNNLCIFKNVNGMFMSNHLTYISDGALAIASGRKYVYIMTNKLNILKLDGNELKIVSSGVSILKELVKYNFLEQLDWRTYYQWLTYHNIILPNLSLFEIVTMRAYGKFLFVGYDWGLLHIYKILKSDTLLSVIRRKPVKKYDVMDPDNLSLCPIIQIDIVEGIDSHYLIIGTPRKLVQIHFVYFKED